MRKFLVLFQNLFCYQSQKITSLKLVRVSPVVYEIINEFLITNDDDVDTLSGVVEFATPLNITQETTTYRYIV